MRSRALLYLLLALGIVVGVIVLVVALGGDDDDAPRAPTPTADAPAEVMVDGADADRKRDDTLKVSPKAQEVFEETERAEDTGVPRGQAHLDVAPVAKEELRGRDKKPAGVLPQGGGSQTFPGCETRFVRSWSARSQAVRAFGVHYTAGPNLPGKADMDGLTAYSNRNPVSWHLLIDREGHCYYSVPLDAKAWTIGNLNSQTINVEMVGRGNEPDYGGSAGRKKLAQVGRELAKRGIPLTLGAVSNCIVTERGWITHWMGGACSGGHVDIKPYSITALIAQMRQLGATSPLTKRERTIARRAAHSSGARKARACRMNAKQRRALRRAGFGTPEGRKRKRGARYQLLQGNYRRHCR
ncbi:MAG: N-acetylmuramoyl-L-alanine amidase [Chloroflexi bacterium]|nr:N-acetylmuramoyl-L-alanine amidase [Chloroflexota bacterium]